jgi:hypothetical protein
MMPRMDGTGPVGAGPLTGGGRGDCITADEGVVRRFLRRGLGRGRGYGRGRGRMRGWHGGVR